MTLSHQALLWLLDQDNPGVRYLALRYLAGLSSKSRELLSAKKEAYEKGPIGEILKHMNPEGYWDKSGAGYNPKYRSTVWSLILLSQLGASVDDDPRIKKACQYYLDHAFSTANSLSANDTPSGTVNCLEGNMTLALTLLGCTDIRLMQTYDWMAKSVIGDGVRYYAYTCGPNFACGVNAKKSCAWGAVKVLLAFGAVSEDKRTSVMKKAIKAGVDFFFSIDPMTAKYPMRTNSPPSRDWWKFGFPLFYITDLLQLAEALASVGYGHDQRLEKTIAFIESKKDDQGRWALEYDYFGKTWGDFGKKREPNKWVTYRALKTLTMVR
jgi:hypothetical protein